MENSTQVVSRSWGHASGMAGLKKAQSVPWAQPNPAGYHNQEAAASVPCCLPPSKRQRRRPEQESSGHGPALT